MSQQTPRDLEAEWRKTISELSQSFLTPTFPKLAWEVHTGLNETFRKVVESLAETARLAQAALEPLRGFLTKLAKEEAKFTSIERAGWLPHHTTPFHLLPAESTPEEIDRILSAYYKENWQTVHAAFDAKLVESHVDEEARETFREVLSAHGCGHYRCAARVLFPEIERIVRMEFFEGDPCEKITSQRKLRDAVGNLTPGHVYKASGEGLRLYSKLAGHLYVKAESVEQVRILAQDPVPNRHAALHGLVVYKTAQNSLNTLVMTEFAIQMIDVLKQYFDKQTEQEQ